ncbi:MAG: DUF4123 domain-containing protein [Magnetococcus sp. DMHC-1]
MTREEAISTLWQTQIMGGQRFPYLYAILDAAADERIYPNLVAMQDEVEVTCLFTGEMAEQVAAVAPYLLRMDLELKVFDWWWENGWGQNWGLFFWTSTSFGAVYEHCRSQTRVESEGKTLLFRYWDPRVLEMVLGVMDDAQKREFFGPIRSFAVANDHEIVTYDSPKG